MRGRSGIGNTVRADVPGELAVGNRITDEAATAAGRDPRRIRRLFDFQGTFGPAARGFLQGPAKQSVDELLPLALEYGMSVFILAGGNARAIERWGSEVAPALRDAVARERRR